MTGKRGVIVDTWHLVQNWRRILRERAVARRSYSLTVEQLLKSVPAQGLAELRESAASSEGQKGYFWTKYLDVEKWLALNIRYARELGLVEQPPKNVLDLGCGGGYFLVVCRHLGARVVGLDLDKDVILNRLIKLFRLKRFVAKIRPITPLPDLGARKFDLITAWMVCFNLPMNRPAWGPIEWDFLLADLRGHLQPGGRVVLSLNRQLDDNELYSDELRAFFESMGGQVDGKRIVFAREGLEPAGRISEGATPPPIKPKRLASSDLSKVVPAPPPASA